MLLDLVEPPAALGRAVGGGDRIDARVQACRPGVELGRGKKLPEIIAGMHGMVAEGVFTTSAAVGLAHARNVEMPITEQMHAILHDGKSPREAIQVLMSRTGKSETNQS